MLVFINVLAVTLLILAIYYGAEVAFALAKLFLTLFGKLFLGIAQAFNGK